MIKENRRDCIRMITSMVGLITMVMGCTPASTIHSTQTTMPVVISTSTNPPTFLPGLTLKPGDYYFSVDGIQSFVFSRNIAGYQSSDYDVLFGRAKVGGSKFIRIQLDNQGGMGFTHSGQVDQGWLVRWDRIFDRAEQDGLYVLPVFSTWHDWNNGNPDLGYTTWNQNPVNQANGGPVGSPAGLFQQGSATRKIWMEWVQALVNHWHGRRNILAWEIFSEVNLATGSTEATGIEFVNTAAALIRSTDPGRLITASIADCPPGSGACYWPNFYKEAEIDFIEMHPYTAQLDRVLVSEGRKARENHGKPVLIGESGLSAATPDSQAGSLTVSENAALGIRHAAWASIVSGTLNGRSLWWEDGYGIYFPALGMRWMEQYQDAELQALKFVDGVDFSGFVPLTIRTTPGIWGAALGNEEQILGWFRDAGCEPPDWKLNPVLSGQTVTITVPGSKTNWRVDFYDTKTGSVIATSNITMTGGQAIISLPDYTDDIAFKMVAEL